MRRYLVPLLAANVVAFVSIGLSYFVYSKLLSAQEFGAYAAALAIGNFAILVLDGGIKTSIIKHKKDLTNQQESALFTAMLGFSVILLLVLYYGQSITNHFLPAAANQTTFVSAFAAVYLISYPWIGLATAALERNLAYGQLAWIESAAIVLERGTPAVFLVLTHLALESFVLGLAIGRVCRIVLLSRLHRVALGWRFKETKETTKELLREGLTFQLGGAASVIRDNLHVILVGSLFGAVWVGYYAWCLQLCAISSQAFVQISARVSLAVTAKERSFSSRWATIKQQIELLTATTAPILAAVVIFAPTLDRYFFDGKWRLALPLLPLLCARMLPGIACTPVGTLLLVEKGAAKYAIALWWWTGVELAAGYFCAKALGPLGLAVSYSIMAWAGIYLLVKDINESSRSLFLEACWSIIRRPGLWVSILISAAYFLCVNRDYWQGTAVAMGTCVLVILAAYLIEPNLRSILRRNRV